MKRYLLFSGATYYPGGGWEDFVGDYDTPEEIQVGVESLPRYQWWHIVDTETKAILEK